MIENQKIIIITIPELLKKVQEYSEKGYRLVQLNCSKIGETYEVNYSFDLDFKFENLKIILTEHATPVPSISSIFWQAFLYENEIHDLFGINVTGMNLDYKGTFYKTAVKDPFNRSKNE